MNQIVFLLEEKSMQAFLEELLPRVLPDMLFRCVPHEGKADLRKSIPRKLREWREPGVRFVILHDNDNRDCRKLKDDLVKLCWHAGRDDTVVRIVCQELEAWYFGDLEAAAAAFGRADLPRIGAKSRYRYPDRIVNPATELRRLVPEFQKISGARRMARRIEPDRSRSPSFRMLIESLRRLAA